MKYLTLIVLLSLLFFCGSPVWADELTILTEEWKPISFSGEDGKPTGLAVEIVQEILRRLNVPDTIEIVSWARAYRMALNDPNVVLFAMTQTPEREQLFKMIGPIAVGKKTFYAKKGSGITISSFDEAKQLTAIGVYRDTAAEQILTQKGFTNLTITSYPIQNVKMLMKGRIDVLSGENLTIGELLAEAGLSRDAMESVYSFGENRLHIGMSKGTSETIVQAWKAALEEMQQDGTFSRIFHKWLPGEETPEQVERVGITE